MRFGPNQNNRTFLMAKVFSFILHVYCLLKMDFNSFVVRFSRVKFDQLELGTSFGSKLWILREKFNDV